MITRNGWTFAGIGTACLVLGVWLQYAELVAIGAGFLLCVALATAWMARRPPITVQRNVPRYVPEGAPASAILTVTNDGRRRTPPIIAVEPVAIAGRGHLDSIAVALRGVPAGAADSVEYALPTDRRGRYLVGPLELGNADPLRLAGGSKQYGRRETLCVHPRVHAVRPLPTGQLRDLDGTRRRRAPAGGDDFRGLRDYVSGDDRRLIHWPSSAKDGTLRVREMDVASEPRHLVVLDTAATSYDDDEAFEDAVRIAASLVVAGIDAGHPTEFRATCGVHVTVREQSGRDGALDELASVQRTDDAGLVTLSVMERPGGQATSLGIVTDQPSRSALANVGRLTSRLGRITLVQVGRRRDRMPVSVGGARGLCVASSVDFVRVWNGRGR